MMFDIRIFLLAALVASPAAFLAAEGQLSIDQALSRLLIVMIGATFAAVLVRTLWPLLAGTTTIERADASPESMLANADLGDVDLSAELGDGFGSPVDDGLDDLLNFDESSAS